MGGMLQNFEVQFRRMEYRAFQPAGSSGSDEVVPEELAPTPEQMAELRARVEFLENAIQDERSAHQLLVAATGREAIARGREEAAIEGSETISRLGDQIRV